MSPSDHTKFDCLAPALEAIEVQKSTGTLVCFHGEFQRILFFHEGRFVFLISEEPRDFLGHYLISKGLIEENLLAQAILEHRQSPEKLGQVLVRLSSLSAEKLQIELAEKIKESFLQIFLLDNARFEFTAKLLETKTLPFMANFDLRELISNGNSRLAEYKKLKALFPDKTQTFTVDRTRLTTELSASKSIIALVSLLEVGQTIEDASLHFHSYEDSILRTLGQLHEAGVIKGKSAQAKVEPRINRSSNPLELLSEIAQEAFIRQDYFKAAETYADILKLDPVDEFARSCLKEIEGRIMKQFEEQNISLDVPLKLSPQLDYTKLKLGPLDGFVLSRIDGNMDITRILSIVPAPAHQVLASIKHLLDAHIIRIGNIIRMAS